MASKSKSKPNAVAATSPPLGPDHHQSAFRYLWDWIVQAPYAGVPWVVLAYALLCSLIYTGMGPFNGHIIGFDDQVRMTQVLQLINGQGWYDHTIMRANAPEGFETIWTRIVDIPLALTVILGQAFTDQRTAALAAVIINPILQLIILFYVARYMARPLVGKKDSWLIVLFLMFTTVLNQKHHTLSGFHLGQASHHSWYIILNALMFGAGMRVAINAPGRSPAFLVGLGMAISLAVGIEGFPIIAGVAGIFSALAWLFDDAQLAKRGAVAVGIGSALTLLLLPMHMPPSRFFEVLYSQPSILGPSLTFAAALFLALEYFILQKLTRHKVVSLIALTILALIFAAGIIFAFPQILDGPAAALSPRERLLAFSEHPEAWPMWRESVSTWEYISLTIPTLIALGAAVYGFRKTVSRRRRILYASYFGFALLSGVMAQMFWRYIHHALTCASAGLLLAWKQILGTLPHKKYYGLAAFGVFVMLDPFWLLLQPAIEFDVPFTSQVLLYPGKIYGSQRASWESCDPLAFSDWLNRHYTKNTLLNVPDWDTAAFLYNTDLRIDFLANYPSHDKFIDNKTFFLTQDLDQSKEIAARHGFDLVAVCVLIPISQESLASRPYRKLTLIETLTAGNIPPWLKPVDTGLQTYYRLFAVDKAALR
jgi:hypothetical protein